MSLRPLFLLTAACGCFASAGCGLLPLPYVAEVAGPVRSVRVCDAATGEDISDARAAMNTGMGMTDWVGTRPPQLLVLPTATAENNGAENSGGLKRRPDHTFEVPRRMVLGLVARHYAQQNPATAMIIVSAPGYPRAMLEYCQGNAPEANWTDSRALSPGWRRPQVAVPEAAARETVEQEIQLVRCEFHDDGVLRFFLHRLTPEMVEAIRCPGRAEMSPDFHGGSRFVSAEEPLPQPAPPPAASR